MFLCIVIPTKDPHIIFLLLIGHLGLMSDEYWTKQNNFNLYDLSGNIERIKFLGFVPIPTLRNSPSLEMTNGDQMHYFKD